MKTDHSLGGVMLKDSVWFLPSDQHRDAEAWLIARVKTDRHTQCPTN
jgi:hypothetical protein